MCSKSDPFLSSRVLHCLRDSISLMCAWTPSVITQVHPWPWHLKRTRLCKPSGSKSAGRFAVAACTHQASIWLNAHLLMQAQAGRVTVLPCLFTLRVCQTLLEEDRLQAAALSAQMPKHGIPTPCVLDKEAAALSSGRKLNLTLLKPGILLNMPPKA